jgi:peptidoglycan hydrolase-like protein with peptidoglycan-binding domain
MDLRDLISKLDSISEQEEYDIEAGKKLNQDKWKFAEKQKHLYGLLQQLRALINKQSNPTSLEEALVQSFGYQVNEMDMDRLATASASNATSAPVSGDGILKTIGKKIAWPVTAAAAIWDAYEQITQLPRNVPQETFEKEVAKIIGNVVGEYGVFAVGAGIGAALGGASGPGALVSGIAGGVAAQWAFGDDVNQLVSYIVDYFYSPDSAPQQTTSPQQPTTASASNNETAPVIKDLQSALEKLGFSVGSHGKDGIFGPDTLAALKQYTSANNLPSDLDAIYKLLNVTAPANTNQISELRSTLDKIDEAKVPSRFLQYAKNVINAVKGKVSNFVSNNRLLTTIATIAAGGYVWDNYGNVIQSKAHEYAPGIVSEPKPEEPATPTVSNAPAPGTAASTTSIDTTLAKLISDIKVDITDLKRITNPEIKADAQKAIAHAEQTLKMYAPGM